MIKHEEKLKNWYRELRRKRLSEDDLRHGRIEEHHEKHPKRSMDEEMDGVENIYDESPSL